MPNASPDRFKFQGVHVWASRQRQLVGDGAWDETLRLSFLSISTAPIRDFVSTAKSSYEELERGNVAVYAPDKYGLWSRSGSRSKRPSDSVHLPANMKERVLKDAKDFTSPANRRWYADRELRTCIHAWCRFALPLPYKRACSPSCLK